MNKSALWLAAIGAVLPALAGTAPISFAYPAPRSIFPADIAAPTFVWNDPEPRAAFWRIEVTAGGRGGAIHATSAGPKKPLGDIDERCAKAGAVAPALPPAEASGHSWRPDGETWAAIKKLSTGKPATIGITGYADERSKKGLSHGAIEIETSPDPVGAPIFFRDVPLISVPTGERGVIMPLPTEAMPFIAWRLRYVNEAKSRPMMEGLPTCVNCHSFSRDGKTLGIDVDGPGNDKGLYGIVPVKPETSIRNEDVIRWSSFAEEKASKRFGFMSQISPDGQFVVTSIESPGSHIKDFDARLFNGFYKDYGFGQVFYPTKGVLAWYSKATGKLHTLPGADNPDLVQTSAFWSADGKYLVFSRARAKEPYYEGQKIATYANDPNETQIQYDLYTIPFNGGKGGEPAPLQGASSNGMSNNFPKVSPDGRWIVFVQNRTGLLMRPDSQLYIVPAQGGKARRLDCNMSPMNSWHSWSPNGKWLVFSSKGKSLYTQMFLTHIDENGQDSPPILIENATAANRAVNIPEFVNAAPGDLAKMDAPAIDFYRVLDSAGALARNGDYKAALPEWRKAVQLDPEDAKARYHLAFALDKNGELREAIGEYRKAVELDPNNGPAMASLAAALLRSERFTESIECSRKALEINPRDVLTEGNLAAALLQMARTDEALQHARRALELDPDFADAHNLVGIMVARAGQMQEGIEHLRRAVAAIPNSLEYRFNLGRVLAANHNFAEAIPEFEKAVELTRGEEPQSLEMLAAMYSEVGRFGEAAATARRALDLAVRTGNARMAEILKVRVGYYESQAGGGSRR